MVDRDAGTGFVRNGAHYIRFIGVKPEFLWFANTCTQGIQIYQVCFYRHFRLKNEFQVNLKPWIFDPETSS